MHRFSVFLLGTVVAMVGILAGPASATNTATLCQAIKDTFDPVEVDDKWVFQNKPTPEQLEAFAEAAQEAGAGSGTVNCGGFTLKFVIRPDGDDTNNNSASANGSADITLAVGGDSTSPAANGGDASSNNAQAGGAAIAVAGSGGGGSTLSSGGSATSTTTGSGGGGDAVAHGGDGADPTDNELRGGNSGSAHASSAGSGPPSSATGLMSEGAAGDGQPGAPVGTHGTGASATAGPTAANPGGPGYGAASGTDGGTTGNVNA